MSYDHKAEKQNKHLPTSCKADLHPQQSFTELSGIIFDSKFDSGNLERVETTYPNSLTHFNLWVCNDCRGTQRATNYRTWFYFSVTGVPADSVLTLKIMNLNFQNKLFKEGMAPVFKSSICTSDWQRVATNITSTTTESGLEISWTHRFLNESEKVWFAFTFPFSCEDNDRMMSTFEESLKDDEDIYFHRCTLIRSKEDRKIELVTISSMANKSTELEKPIPHLFPDSRPALFKGKKCVFLSARVHPGETPSSHVFNGAIQRILDRDDPSAKILRDNFVFYCVAIINPDGVYRGHYRTDSLGQNLNRFYINPSLTEHSGVYAIKELILQLNESKRLHCYIDLHAHATKKGIFIYGNCVDLKDQLETCLFPRLISMNSPYFEYESCNFTEKNMYSRDKGDGLSKEGAGRVALYKATKLNLCYTLECNYNGGTFSNKEFEFSRSNTPVAPVPLDQYDSDIIVNGVELQNVKATPSYTKEMFESVGSAICDSLLDYSSIHPYSRLTNSPFKSLANLKMRMAVNLLKIQPFRFGQYLRKMIRYIQSNENLDRVLRCLWIFLHTGIKNEMSDNSKPLIYNEKVKPTQQISTINPIKKVIANKKRESILQTSTVSSKMTSSQHVRQQQQLQQSKNAVDTSTIILQDEQDAANEDQSDGDIHLDEEQGGDDVETQQFNEDNNINNNSSILVPGSRTNNFLQQNLSSIVSVSSSSNNNSRIANKQQQQQLMKTENIAEIAFAQDQSFVGANGSIVPPYYDEAERINRSSSIPTPAVKKVSLHQVNVVDSYLMSLKPPVVRRPLSKRFAPLIAKSYSQQQQQQQQQQSFVQTLKLEQLIPSIGGHQAMQLYQEQNVGIFGGKQQQQQLQQQRIFDRNNDNPLSVRAMKQQHNPTKTAGASTGTPTVTSIIKSSRLIIDTQSKKCMAGLEQSQQLQGSHMKRLDRGRSSQSKMRSTTVAPLRSSKLC